MARVCRYSEGELVDYIRREILAGKYKPREHLVEKELSDRYHVSRTPIREALTQLEAMGLVVREKHKGAMVADIDLKTIHEMQQVRACLEGMIARLAANRLVEEDLAILERYVSKPKWSRPPRIWILTSIRAITTRSTAIFPTAAETAIWWNLIGALCKKRFTAPAAHGKALAMCSAQTKAIAASLPPCKGATP